MQPTKRRSIVLSNTGFTFRSFSNVYYLENMQQKHQIQKTTKQAGLSSFCILYTGGLNVFVGTHPTESTHRVTDIIESYFDFFGCPPSNLLIEFISQQRRENHSFFRE